jgi:hypothetical protein
VNLASPDAPEWADLTGQFIGLGGAYPTPPHVPAVGLQEQARAPRPAGPADPHDSRPCRNSGGCHPARCGPRTGLALVNAQAARYPRGRPHHHTIGSCRTCLTRRVAGHAAGGVAAGPEASTSIRFPIGTRNRVGPDT